MIWVTTLDDRAIEERMDEFKKLYSLSKNKTVRKYNELFPASLLLEATEKKIVDCCSNEEIQMLHGFFQNCYSFTLFQFIVNNTWPPKGLIRSELSRGPQRYLAQFISSKWTERIQAQTFLSDQALDRDDNFMTLLKQLPPLERFDFKPPSLFGDFFRDLYDEVFFNNDFLLKNNGVDFNTLMSSVKEEKLSPHGKNMETLEKLFAFYNHKTRKLLFHFLLDENYDFQIINPIY